MAGRSTLCIALLGLCIVLCTPVRSENRPLIRFVGLENAHRQGRSSKHDSGTVETIGFHHLDDVVEELEIKTTNESLPLIVKRNAQGKSGSFVGMGRDSSNAPVTVSLVETTKLGILQGYVLFKDVHFTIKSGPSGLVFEQRSSDDYWDEEDPIVDSGEGRSGEGKAESSTVEVPPWNRRLNDGDRAVASVMVVVPSDVACLLLEKPADCDANTNETNAIMEGFATSTIQLANAAYENSEIDFSLELAAVKIENWEALGKSSTQQLVALHRGRDFLALRRKRDSLGADFMFLLSAFPGSCGLAYVAQDWNLSYGIVHVACIPNHSFTHEIGHTMGCDHNIEHSLNTEGYAFGYRTPSFRTIMAHKCESGNPCPRVPHFSNPDVLYNGVATGSNDANNAHWIQEHRHVFPAYRVTCEWGWSWSWCIYTRSFWQILDYIVSFFFR